MNATETKVTIRARAFQGRLETLQCVVEADGTVLVYDAVAGHYTHCHSLSARDLGRVRAKARRSAEGR